MKHIAYLLASLALTNPVWALESIPGYPNQIVCEVSETESLPAGKVVLYLTAVSTEGIAVYRTLSAQTITIVFEADGSQATENPSICGAGRLSDLAPAN